MSMFAGQYEIAAPCYRAVKGGKNREEMSGRARRSKPPFQIGFGLATPGRPWMRLSDGGIKVRVNGRDEINMKDRLISDPPDAVHPLPG